MEKKYLNEENYQESKKKLLKISLIILIIGVVIGVGLIITGVVLSSNAKGFNIDLNPEQENTEVLRAKSEVQADIATLETEIDSLEIEQNKIFRDEGFSDKYYEIESKSKEKKKELDKLESQLSSYKVVGIFNTTSDKISKGKYIPLYMFGGFIILVSCIISFAIFNFAKRREILAFTAQQVMPVAQEGIEKITPTVANAAGSIAKSISKGIQEGKTEADNK